MASTEPDASLSGHSLSRCLQDVVQFSGDYILHWHFKVQVFLKCMALACMTN